jgi:PAS domain S-box-containing protein
MVGVLGFNHKTNRTGSQMSKITNKSDEQKGAEAEVDSFRKDLGPFVVATETTRMAMVFTDAKEPGSPIIFANASFLSVTGYEREEVLGQSFNSLMARGVGPESLAHVEAAFAGSLDEDLVVHYRRKDASEFWADIFISPVRDESGDVVQHFVSFVDLTRHKEEQAHSKMLIDELNHRVKNTLSTVQSITWQAFRRSSDPEVIQDSIESRLFALSRSHDLLTRQNWEGAGLLDLVNAALEPFGVANGRRERFAIMGKNIRLPPKPTLALGIAFHELATNAVKYGAFSNDTGSIRIAWAVEPTPEGNRLILQWQEKDGPPVALPSQKGFGSQVIERGLAHELEGAVSLEYRPEGLVCTIDIPFPQVARDG